MYKEPPSQYRGEEAHLELYWRVKNLPNMPFFKYDLNSPSLYNNTNTDNTNIATQTDDVVSEPSVVWRSRYTSLCATNPTTQTQRTADNADP
jgi:hypothetical protein